MITKQKKSEIIDSVKGDIKKANIVMFANFHGLNVKLVSELRKLLRQVDSKYFVTRKTLVKKLWKRLLLTARCPVWKEKWLSCARTETRFLPPAP